MKLDLWRQHRFRSILLTLAIFGSLVVVGRSCYLFLAPSPPRRLAGIIRPGLSLGEIRARARESGCKWLVDLSALERQKEGGQVAGKKISGEPGHIICHFRGPSLDSSKERPPVDVCVCENARTATSYGMLFASEACNIIIKDRKVKTSWFNMD